MTKNARRIIWRARWILLLHWLGRRTDQNLLDWARFIVKVNG